MAFITTNKVKFSNNRNINKIVNKNKEKSSFSEYLYHIQTNSQYSIGNPLSSNQRPLLCTSSMRRPYKASVTVEISMVVPLFLVGFLCLVFLLEMMSIQLSVRSAMGDVGRYFGSNQLTVSDITHEDMESELITILGAETLDNSILVNGSAGLDLSASEVDQSHGVVQMIVHYNVALPFPRFLDLGMAYEERLIFKRWTGYGGGGYFDNGQIVYITEYQSVYHTNPNCTHLQLQITLVEASSVSNLVNENDRSYSSCGTCKPGDLEQWDYVYITTTGSAYHDSLECSSLKRTVVSVSIEDVIGKGVCQRCGGV